MSSATRMIPYGRQALDEADIQAVVATLRSDWLTCGPTVERFERALAERCGAQHAIVVANGTAALHVAMLAADIKAGQRVLTSPNTFVASANCAAYVGATPDFADIDPLTLNLSAEALAARWQEDVRAVVAVDFAGFPCDMPRIAALARARNAVVIEDAAHALGSRFQEQGVWHKVGGHPWADLTTLSFHPVKTITTGEGGAILTDDATLAKRCRQFRAHGITRDGDDFQFDPNRPGEVSTPDVPRLVALWYYEMQRLGFNYRITDFQCALGLSQLNKLDGFMQRRQQIVDRYHVALAGAPFLRLPVRRDFAAGAFGPVEPSWHLFVVQIDFAALGRSRAAAMQWLRERGIGTQVHYFPVHLQPYYRQTFGYAVGRCPVAETYYQRCLSLPLYPAMTDQDVEQVIVCLQELLGVRA